MKNNKASTHTHKDLIGELQALVSEAETLMAESLSEHTAEAIGKLKDRYGAAQERFADIYDSTKKKVLAGAKQTDSTIRGNPYQSLAIAAGVGVLLGFLVGRRK
jgi:ElaB/YqjD/DUF883 family membrane-anchored ribosome-binding protein